MTCQRCHNQASVHLTERVDGRRQEFHLCTDCARQAGIVLPESPPSLALDSVVQDLVLAHVGELAGELAELCCPDCGTRFMDFRGSGRLGCPSDYASFSKGLLPLLQRIHGATRHVGKVAARRPDAGERLRMRAMLREAVAREDYEEAARLRDRLRARDSHA